MRPPLAASARWVVAALLAGATSLAGCMLLYPLDERASPRAPGDAGAGSRDGSPTEDGRSGCTSNLQCSMDNYDQPARCDRATGTCRLLKTDDCPIVLGSWQSDSVFLFGAYAAIDENDFSGDTDVVWNYKLAINELNAGGGLPDRHNVSHPLAAVVCNNAPGRLPRDTPLYTSTIQHLTGDLGMTAVIADLPPGALIEAYRSTRATRSGAVFLLSPGAPNDAVVDLDDDGLVWNLLGSPRDLAPGYRSLVRRIEAYIKNNVPGRAPGELRIAIVRSADPNEPNHELLSELNEAVVPVLDFNGRSWAANEGNRQQFIVDRSSNAGSPAAVAAQIKAYAPDIMISMAGPDFLATNEDNQGGVAYNMLANSENQHQTPFYLLSPANAGPPIALFSKVVFNIGVSYPVVYHRFLGINVAGADDRAVYQRYLTRIRAVFPAHEQFENYYDAVYYLAYSAYVAGLDHTLDGLELKTGMGRLTNGTRVEVGPAAMPAALTALQPNNGSILLAGAGGAAFDVPHGLRIDAAALFCVESGPQVRSRTQVYDALRDTWSLPDVECAPGL